MTPNQNKKQKNLIKKIFEKNFEESIEVKKKFLNEKKNILNLNLICNQLIKHLNLGGKIYFAGNGGSASDSCR